MGFRSERRGGMGLEGREGPPTGGESLGLGDDELGHPLGGHCVDGWPRRCVHELVDGVPPRDEEKHFVPIAGVAGGSGNEGEDTMGDDGATFPWPSSDALVSHQHRPLVLAHNG